MASAERSPLAKLQLSNDCLTIYILNKNETNTPLMS